MKNDVLVLSPHVMCQRYLGKCNAKIYSFFFFVFFCLIFNILSLFFPPFLSATIPVCYLFSISYCFLFLF